jgi:hypothetical protein
MDQSSIELWLGAAFVAINAYERFNTPATNRASTTVARYSVSAVVYVCAALLTYLILSNYPKLLEALGSMPDSVNRLPPALMTALALTVLLDKVPFFLAMDRWLRDRLLRMASIPYEALRLSRKLQRSDFGVSPEMRDRVAARLVREAMQDGDIQFDAPDTPQHLLTKATVLVEHLEQWETERRFGGFMNTFAQDLNRLKERHGQLVKKASAGFSLAREVAAQSTDTKTEALARAFVSEFKEQAEQLLKDLCDYISRAVLHTRASQSARVAELRSLGFSYEGDDPEAKMSFNDMSALFVLLAAILLFGMVVAGQQARSMGELIFRVIMISTIYCVAVSCALYPKDRWPLAARGANGERPTAFYLLAGAMAAVFGMAISVVFKLVLFGFDIDRVVSNLGMSYPWMLLTFTVAASTAFMLDNPRGAHPRLQAVVEGLAEAAIVALAGWLTWRWLGSIGHPFGHKALFPYTLPMMAVNGLLIGLLVPSWYRRCPHRPVAAPGGATPVLSVAVNAA